MTYSGELCRCCCKRPADRVAIRHRVTWNPMCQQCIDKHYPTNDQATGWTRACYYEPDGRELPHRRGRPKEERTMYLIGSLRNPRVPEIAAALRNVGWDVFDDWYAAGAEADQAWRDYEKARGHTVVEGLKGYAAQHVFNFDKTHIDRCSAAMLVAPAGKSGHLELGYVLGREKPGYYLLDGDPDRWDVMLNFATAVFKTLEEATTCLTM